MPRTSTGRANTVGEGHGAPTAVGSGPPADARRAKAAEPSGERGKGGSSGLSPLEERGRRPLSGIGSKRHVVVARVRSAEAAHRLHVRDVVAAAAATTTTATAATIA